LTLSRYFSEQIQDGRIAAIEGGADARILRDYLHTYGDENAYVCPAEASVGVNRRALVRGVQRDDKNIRRDALRPGCQHRRWRHRPKRHPHGRRDPRTYLHVDGELRIHHGRFTVPVELEQHTEPLTHVPS